MMSTRILLRLVLVLCTALSICVRVNGTEEETYALHSPSISPDGKTVVFVSDHRNGNPDVYRIGIDGKSLKRLTDGKAWYSDPAWSPDGRTIACTKGDYPKESVTLMGSDGSKPRTITKGKSDEAEPAWMPDGTKLIVTTSRNGNADLMLITSSGGEERYIAATREAEINPNCSHDGEWVAYEISDFSAGSDGDTYQIHIWKKSLTEAHAQPIQLTTGSHVDSTPHFSPDGTKICFARSRDGDGIWIMNSDGTNLQRVPIDAFDAYDPSWSPDGQKLVFVRDVKDPLSETIQTEICSVNLDGTGLTQITNIAPLFQAASINEAQPSVASCALGDKSHGGRNRAIAGGGVGVGPAAILAKMLLTKRVFP